MREDLEKKAAEQQAAIEKLQRDNIEMRAFMNEQREKEAREKKKKEDEEKMMQASKDDGTADSERAPNK